MKASQLAVAEQIIKIVDGETDTTIFVEMCRVYGASIALARFITRGDVRTISTACGEDLGAALDALETITKYGTWEKPGMDVFAFVTTDGEGFVTALSTLTVGGIHVAKLFASAGEVAPWGALATRSVARIAQTLVGMGLNLAADFSNGTKALTEHRDDEGSITGYSFTAHHRSA